MRLIGDRFILSTKSPDEECLPFKALWALMFNSRLRLYVEPESLHCIWNDLKNSYKRADFQPALLLGILITQMAHGPFLSGGHQWTKERTAEIISQTITESEFQALRENMLNDRYGEITEIPQTRADIPHLRSVENLTIFVSRIGFTYVNCWLINTWIFEELPSELFDNNITRLAGPLIEFNANILFSQFFSCPTVVTL